MSYTLLGARGSGHTILYRHMSTDTSYPFLSWNIPLGWDIVTLLEVASTGIHITGLLRRSRAMV